MAQVEFAFDDAQNNYDPAAISNRLRKLELASRSKAHRPIMQVPPMVGVAAWASVAAPAQAILKANIVTGDAPNYSSIDWGELWNL